MINLILDLFSYEQYFFKKENYKYIALGFAITIAVLFVLFLTGYLIRKNKIKSKEIDNTNKKEDFDDYNEYENSNDL